MHLALGSRRYDLRTRALVMGVLGPPDQLVDQGADLLEVDRPDRTLPVPICVAAPDDASVDRALAQGADLVRVLRPSASSLRSCAAAGVAVLVPDGAAGEAAAAGLPPERVLVDSLLLDVTADDYPLAATVVGVIRGARIVRTPDVRGARRVCDVLAAVLEAR